MSYNIFLNGLKSKESEKINLEIQNFSENKKNGIKEILENQDLYRIKQIFLDFGIESYYDFYFLKLGDFKNILSSDLKLQELYRSCKFGDKISYPSRSGMLKFAEFIGFNREKISQISLQVKNILKEDSNIEYLNEFLIFGLNKFKSKFIENNIIRYFCIKITKKALSDIKADDYEKIGKKIGLEFLDEDQLKFEIKNVLNKESIIYSQDLDNISLDKFKVLIRNNLLIESYFLSKGIFKSHITIEDFEDFKNDIKLEKRLETKNEFLNRFLRENGVINFNDLVDFKRTGIRTILWEEEKSREILEGFGLKKLQDFRYEHIIRFARFIGIKGVPEELTYDENQAKLIIINYLNNNGVSCIYSLKFIGIKKIKLIFRQSQIGKNNYFQVSNFIKNNFGILIDKLNSEKLEDFGKLIGLPILTDKEHKEKLLNVLNANGEKLDELNKQSIRAKNKYWTNPQVRYFLEKSGFVSIDIKQLRSGDVKNMIKYIKGI